MVHSFPHWQRLRESNAKFVRSFKLFSDGGNYCPEEIEDFRKRLEKLTQVEFVVKVMVWMVENEWSGR